MIYLLTRSTASSLYASCKVNKFNFFETCLAILPEKMGKNLCDFGLGQLTSSFLI